VVDPADYPQLLAALGGEGTPEERAALRRRLAWKAFQHTSSYDSAVAEWDVDAAGCPRRGGLVAAGPR